MADRLMLLSLAWSAGSLVPWLATLQRGAVVVVIAAGVLPDLRRAPRRWGALLLCAALLTAPGLPLGAAACLLLVAAGLLAAQSGPNSLPAAIGLLLVTAGQAAAAVLVAVGPAAADVGRLCYAAGLRWWGARRDPGLRARPCPIPDGGVARARGPRGVDPRAVVLRSYATHWPTEPCAFIWQMAPGREEARVVEVGGVPWVWICSDRGVLDDAGTWHAVRQLVAQVGAHRQLVEAERVRASEVSESRSRLIAAADRERLEVAETLRDRVLVPLRDAAGFLGSAPLLAVELQTAVREVEALLMGQSPFRLGAGAVVRQYGRSLRGLPSPVHLDPQDVCADEATEQAVWAVVAEGLTNAWKHSHATEVAVRIGSGRRLADRAGRGRRSRRGRALRPGPVGSR